jgi:hypothetical protein
LPNHQDGFSPKNSRQALLLYHIHRDPTNLNQLAINFLGVWSGVQITPTPTHLFFRFPISRLPSEQFFFGWLRIFFFGLASHNRQTVNYATESARAQFRLRAHGFLISAFLGGWRYAPSIPLISGQRTLKAHFAIALSTIGRPLSRAYALLASSQREPLEGRVPR